MSAAGGLRVGDADRDRAAADLGEHFALGRLSADEHAERVDAAWTARTRADLDVLFHDLPVARPTASPVPWAGAERRQRPRGWRPVPFVPLAILLVVLSVVTGAPFWVAIFVLGCGLFSRAHRRLGPRRTSSPASAAW
jgi:hypothetical protein